jgi:hypothetical protein
MGTGVKFFPQIFKSNHMKRISILYVLLALLCVELSAQVGCNNWVRGGGGAASDGFPSGVLALDGGKTYLAGSYASTATFDGQTLSTASPNGLFLNEYDAQGNLVWAKTIATGQAFFGFQTITTSGGDLYLLGGSSSITVGNNSMTSSNMFLIKADTAGNVLWSRIYGPSSVSIYFSDAVADGSGGLFLCGRVRGTVAFDTDTISANLTQVLLAHIDGAGNVLWVKQSDDPTVGSSLNRANSIARSASGNLIVSGYYRQNLIFGGNAVFDPNGATHNKIQMWVGAFDQNGNNLWLKGQTTNSAISFSGFDVGYSVATDATNNIYVVGSVSDDTDLLGLPMVSSGSEPVLIKLDPQGNALWATRLTPTGTLLAPNGLGVFTSVQIDAMQEPIVSGWINDTFTVASQTIGVDGASELIAARMSASGTLVQISVMRGGDLYENTYASDLDADDNLLIAGAFSSKTLTLVPGSPLTNANQVPTDTIGDVFVLKLCRDALTGAAPAQVVAATLFPNPNNGLFSLRWAASTVPMRLEICDMLGKVALKTELEAGTTEQQIDGAAWPSGLYTWRIVAGNDQVAQGKFSLIRP